MHAATVIRTTPESKGCTTKLCAPIRVAVHWQCNSNVNIEFLQLQRACSDARRQCAEKTDASSVQCVTVHDARPTTPCMSPIAHALERPGRDLRRMNIAASASERRGSREVAHEEVPARRSFAADAMAGATSAATAPLHFLPEGRGADCEGPTKRS